MSIYINNYKADNILIVLEKKVKDSFNYDYRVRNVKSGYAIVIALPGMSQYILQSYSRYFFDRHLEL